MATPFVQGRLRGAQLSVTIDSSCAMCSIDLSIDVSDQLDWTVPAGPGTMLLFEPEIHWPTFTAPTIVRDY